jgi:diguanylate cyclase
MLMADPERAVEILCVLDAMGVTFAIDDFGTGYSSLASLKRLPVHRIKIDRSFVLNMRHDPSDAAIVASTIDLARNLGLRAVAEGIEHPAVASELVAMGCTEGQGYAFAKPMRPDDFIEWALERPDTSAMPDAASAPVRLHARA